MDRRKATFVVPGGVEAVTGGNLYDTYVIRALRRNGWDVSVEEPRGAYVGADVVVLDSLAFTSSPPSTDTPILALVHQLPSQANNRPDRADAEHRTLAEASLVVVVARHLRDAVAPMTGAPVEVVPPGRDHAWAPDGARLEGSVVLCVANAVPGKGVPDAVAAFARAAIAGAKLVIVGDPEKTHDEAQRIRAAAAEADTPVRLLGVVPPEALSELYADACLFLSGSRYEGWPIAVSEAMASGLPVVGYDAPGVRELVRSGTDGLLVPIGDIEALSKAITEVFADGSRAARMGTSARQRALAWPTWQDTGERFIRILATLVR